jgi:hypothetical protein
MANLRWYLRASLFEGARLTRAPAPLPSKERLKLDD